MFFPYLLQSKDLFFLPAVVSFFLSSLVTWFVVKYARALGVLDNPKKRAHPATLHASPIPRGGGISLYLAILIASLLFLPLDQRLLGILIGGAIIVFIGFLDDRRDLSPYWRLISQLLAALVVVASGIGIAFITNPLGGGMIDLSQPRLALELLGDHKEVWLLSAGFAVIWIVTIMNAVSWSSGVDGQLSGFATIAALIIAILSFRFSSDITQWPVTILAAACFGAFLGFLPWHIYPQKIMPGFSGATFAGFMLAVLSILTTSKVGTLLLVLAVPIADSLYIVARRILSGRSPVKGDRGHLHHRLLDIGWSKRQVAYFYWIITAALGLLALYLNARGKFYTMIAISLTVGFVTLWLAYLSRFLRPPDPDNG